jgi:CRISPR-associated endonuclease/helicase Cas3
MRSYESDFESARRWLFRKEKVQGLLTGMDLADAVDYRLKTQFIFSILLDADKVFLAVGEAKANKGLKREPPALRPCIVDQYLARLPASPINPLRQRARRRVLANLESNAGCHTITLPTGMGKTLIAADWALRLRNRIGGRNGGRPPKIIIALPYLSIIDQTEQVWRRLLGKQVNDSSQSALIMASHSLSDRNFELEGESLDQSHADFFLDTWRSEVVVTTFDQLLLALFSPRTRHLLRFHHLMNALVVLDEVQTLPCHLWDLVDNTLRGLTITGQSRVLMMSATLPSMLSMAEELAGDQTEVDSLFRQFNRYRFQPKHRESVDLRAFVGQLGDRLRNWIDRGTRVMITLNTRGAARAVHAALSAKMRESKGQIPVHLITADVAPLDRLKKIECVKTGCPCIVVSTQTVEAGVDIDMDFVIRDLAPLDALIQVAGRCNRNNKRGALGGTVELVALTSVNGMKYAQMIYDPVLLGTTFDVLGSSDEIREEDVLALSRRYFSELKLRKNIGTNLTRAFARWEQMEDIEVLLRGQRTKEVSFIVRCDPMAADLIRGLGEALTIQDRWTRRSALRGLAGPLQRRTVTVFADQGWEPNDFADPLGHFWVLRDQFYSAEKGINLNLEEGSPTCVF